MHVRIIIFYCCANCMSVMLKYNVMLSVLYFLPIDSNIITDQLISLEACNFDWTDAFLLRSVDKMQTSSKLKNMLTTSWFCPTHYTFILYNMRNKIVNVASWEITRPPYDGLSWDRSLLMSTALKTSSSIATTCRQTKIPLYHRLLKWRSVWIATEMRAHDWKSLSFPIVYKPS